ncbi:DNA-binding protein [Bacillus wiedmannii]|uniref:DNA-binding protein n=1 Tax=Bacillus wiedmannii TaxID=1890302 RepID=UPI000BF18B29|nr:DNA-binding protein [Bacillus wiedmannii]PEM34493.1 DNA-binding protein [Bacillus wiedmannii]PEP31787.1 DNA-binding protein [Bacillus wiedmannii]PFZ46362.1 DNA-binding protein [Bacillus wiedmannii]PGA88478.1 DNA-binding protein [Bacillus wiedmannii]PHF55994.1 DNA-binding protein [Bacillus wiedmannii]
MFERQEINMNTNEVKAYLGISSFIFNTLMKQGQLTPINRETWRLDGSFLFKREDIEKLKKDRETEGITLYQAAKDYNVSMYQLEKWIEEGDLTCTIQKHRNRETKFVNEEEIHGLVEKLDQTNTLYTFSQKYNVVLFQKFMEGNKLARIISIPKRGDIMLIDEFGSNMTLEDAIKVGYKPAYVLSDKPRSHHKKFVKFRFPKSNQLRSNTFHLIDLLLQYVSPRNIKVSEEDGFWYFDVRQSIIQLPMQMQIEWIDCLTPYIIEGKLTRRVNNSVYLDSSSVTKAVTITSNEYHTITKIVNETNSSIEEFIASAIRDKINQHML